MANNVKRIFGRLQTGPTTSITCDWIAAEDFDALAQRLATVEQERDFALNIATVNKRLAEEAYQRGFEAGCRTCFFRPSTRNRTPPIPRAGKGNGKSINSSRTFPVHSMRQMAKRMGVKKFAQLRSAGR